MKPLDDGARVFELGCGNGTKTKRLWLLAHA